MTSRLLMLCIIVILAVIVGFLLISKRYPVYPGVISKAVVYKRALSAKEVHESYTKDKILPGFVALSLTVKELPKKGETIETNMDLEGAYTLRLRRGFVGFEDDKMMEGLVIDFVKREETSGVKYWVDPPPQIDIE